MVFYIQEAAAETAVFEDYEAEYRNKVTYSQLRGISVRFEGLGVREVDGNCPIAKVKNNLALARPGQVMNLLIHQQTGELLAMETEDVVVLSYEDYVKYYRRHDAFNVIFGLLIYTGAAGLILELKKEKRK